MRDGPCFTDTAFEANYSAWPGHVHGGVGFASFRIYMPVDVPCIQGSSRPAERFRIEFVKRISIDEKTHLVGRVTNQGAEIVSVKAVIFRHDEL